ncbi:MAG: glycine cleavage system protein GcvH [Verrucomicrobia bacterium]|nr:glycine cleavage system protein GcvH [Verrucomicrobiota bacterium]
MEFPEDLRYTKSHEWARVSGDRAVCGITDFAQHELSDVVYVELPEIGGVVTAGEQCAVVESVKIAADIYAPLSGTVTKVNTGLDGAPETVNTDPHGAGWLFELELSDPAELDGLMDADAYKAHTEAEKH